MHWQGKAALITGASSGIGEALARRLAALGVRVALASRSADKLAALAKETGGLAVPTDVTDEAACKRAVDAAVREYGKLDLLVCSAGVSMRSMLEETDLGAIERLMRVNFFGTLYATHAAIPYVKAARGSLVAVSSLAGKRGVPTFAAYSATKFAVQGLYEALRMELAPSGVHVGIVSPGHIDTPMRDNILGPDGEPWPVAPAPPFRLWPVGMLVPRIVALIEKRRPELLFPGFVGPLMALDYLLGTWLGDRVVSRRVAKAPLPPAADRG
ncbi:MAG: SDR family oxidoreductase [Gemmataceae bacterium]|nr:SDR family oxidoreductase [Gemmataceae bacterium]